MPTYDYICRSCGARFELRMSITAYSEGPKPKCGECGSDEVDRAFSAVNVITSGGSSGSGSSGPACGSGSFT